MLLMTSNTRSGGGSQGRASFARRVSGRSAAESLDGRWSGGYFHHRCPMLCFQQVHAQQPPRLHGTTTEECFFLLAADSTHVHPQQLVNANVFAPCSCSTLIPETFLQGNLRFLHSSLSGVTCHP